MFLEGILKPLAISLAGGSLWILNTTLFKQHPEYIWMHYTFLSLFALGLLLIIALLLKGAYSSSISNSLGGKKHHQIKHQLNALRAEDNESLIQFLKDKAKDNDVAISHLAIETLEEMQSEKAFAALVSIWNDSQKRHSYCLQAISNYVCNEKVSHELSRKIFNHWGRLGTK